MSLSDLVAGSHSPQPAAPSGLGSMVRQEVAAVAQPPAVRMSLPQAMRALERGEIARPVDDGELGGLVMNVELPSMPAPAEPRRSPVLDEIHAEAVANAEIVRREMAYAIATKRGITIQAALQWVAENENE
jgi:hypothetical protein